MPPSPPDRPIPQPVADLDYAPLGHEPIVSQPDDSTFAHGFRWIIAAIVLLPCAAAVVLLLLILVTGGEEVLKMLSETASRLK